MPTDEGVLGFSNRWYTEAAATATQCVLPGGTTIQLIAAPVFVATKFEAFLTRGNSDVLASHDLEDIINVVEGRAAFVEEVRATNKVLRGYLQQRFTALVSMPYFFDLLPGIVTQDALHVQRLALIRQRLSALAIAE